jgi:chromosome segregation ATPase
MLALCGVCGCTAARSSLSEDLATRFDRRLSELETKNSELEQQIYQLKIDSSDKDQRLLKLQESLSSISTETAPPSTQASSAEAQGDPFSKGFRKAVAVPLGSEEMKP